MTWNELADPRGESLELRTLIGLLSKPTGNVAAGLSFFDETRWASYVATWNALLDRFDPAFLSEIKKIDVDDSLTILGKRKAWLTSGLSTAQFIDTWRGKYVPFFEKQAADEQTQIDAATAKRFAPPTDPTQIATLATRLAAFSQAEIAALYIAAEPGLQVAIEAVAALTGGKIPLRNDQSWALWVDMIPKDIRAQEASERSVIAAPDATKRKSDALIIRDSYKNIATCADKLVVAELSKRGALPADLLFTDPAMGGQSSVPAIVVRRAAANTASGAAPNIP